jgi:hypothetical protein
MRVAAMIFSSQNAPGLDCPMNACRKSAGVKLIDPIVQVAERQDYVNAVRRQ